MCMERESDLRAEEGYVSLSLLNGKSKPTQNLVQNYSACNFICSSEEGWDLGFHGINVSRMADTVKKRKEKSTA